VNPFWKKKLCRWIILMLIFGVGPLSVFLVGINPATYRISDFKDRVHVQTAGTSMLSMPPAAASDQELQQLESFQKSYLSRLKKIDNNESLLRFSGIIADALALKARFRGLRVTGVDFQNNLIKGTYLPGNDRALDALNQLPGVEWNELADPLDLPMLKLPSIEIQMTVIAEYSEVFSFIESLPEFPAQVSLVGIVSTTDSNEKGFRLKIRSYYFDGVKQPKS
jgi:hypothetical protein